MLKRVWPVTSVIVALAALVVGSLVLPGSVTRPTGVLVIVIGLMPVAMLLAGTPDRRRMVGVFHVAAGVLFGIAGCVLASRNDFLELRLASIDWRILATSGHSLAPVGWMAIGVALTLTGTGVLRSRRGFEVLSALLVILTNGYFAGSLAVAPYLRLRRLGVSQLDPQAVAVAVVLALVALLLLVAALTRFTVTWMPLIPDRPGNPQMLGDDSAHPDQIIENRAGRPGRRWAKPAVWSAAGVAVVMGISVWVWLTWVPRIVLAEAFPDPNLATCVAREMGLPGSSAKVSHNSLTNVRSLSCNGDLVQTSATGSANSAHPLEDRDKTRIRSIRGLETLPNLATLNLANNGISDLTRSSTCRH